MFGCLCFGPSVLVVVSDEILLAAGISQVTVPDMWRFSKDDIMEFCMKFCTTN